MLNFDLYFYTNNPSQFIYTSPFVYFRSNLVHGEGTSLILTYTLNPRPMDFESSDFWPLAVNATVLKFLGLIFFYQIESIVF